MMEKELPRVALAHLPTAVEPLPRLSEALGGPTLLVKRDDQTGLAFGGNKTRKLEFLVAEAQEQGCHTLMTTGAVQSNHCRQTAAAAARAGMACILVLGGQPPSEPEGNVFLDMLMGAELRWAGSGDKKEALKEAFAKAKEAGRMPYLVPYGGSNPTGAAAYAYAMAELMKQNVPADWVVFASSSGGTQAGLAVGARLYGFKGKVLGVSVDEEGEVLRPKIAALANETAARLGASITFSPGEIMVSDEYLGRGYAMMGEPEEEAIRLFAREEGLLLDPVYTGRAAAGLTDLIRKGFFKDGETVLFWHTGGTPALFVGEYRQGILEDA